MALTFGSSFEFSSSVPTETNIVKLSSTKIAIFFKKGTQFYVIIGEISSGSISFGTALLIATASNACLSIAVLSATSFVVAYSYQSCVCTVSGKVVTAGLVYNTMGVYPSYLKVIALSSTKVAVVSGQTSISQVIIGTVSGTVITYGTAITFSNNSSVSVDATRIDDATFAVGYGDSGNSKYGTAVIGTVIGTVPSFGTPYVFHNTAVDKVSIVSLDTTTLTIAAVEKTGSYSKAWVGTVSGTVITYGAIAEIYNGDTQTDIGLARIDDTTAAISYVDVDNSSYGKVAIGTVNGTDIVFDSPETFTETTTRYTDVISVDSTSIVVSYKNTSTSKGLVNIGTLSVPSVLETLNSDAKIVGRNTDTIDSDTTIINGRVSETLNSDATIKTLDNIETLASDAKIVGQNTDTIDSDAKIVGQNTDTIYSDAVIKTLGNSRTLESSANITNSHSNDIDSDAIIKQSGVKGTTDSDAMIKQTGVVSTVTSDAYILSDDLKYTLLSDAKIVNKSSETIDSEAMIRYHKDFFSRAELKREEYLDFNTQLKVTQATPNDPTGLTATDIYTGEAIELAWDDVSNYGYNVYKDVGGEWIQQNGTIITNISYVAGGLTADVTYTFKVTGVNGEGTESTGVQIEGTPTYNAQELITKPVWLVYIDDVETDVVLDRIELVYGPDLSRASFHIMTNPSSGTIPDADYQSVVIYVNSRKVFTGTLIKKTSVYSPSELRVSYEALSSLWTYTRTCVGKNFNEFAKPWEYIYNTSLLYQSGCPWALPTKKVYGPVSVADSTKLEFMNSMCSYAGNYKVHCDENGSVSYHRVGNNMYTRTLEIGKHILNENLSVDKSDSVGQVSVYSDYQKNTTSKKVSYTAIEGLVMLDSSFFNLPEPITISAGAGQQQIQDVQVFALVGKPPRVLEYLNDIEVQPGHCYVGVTSTALSKWEDGPVTSDGEVSHLSGSEGRFPVKNYEEYQPVWQSFPALVEYSKDGTEATVTLQGTPVAYNTNILPYTAKFYKQDNEGETVESTLEINIWNKPTAYATEIVLVYSYLTDRLSSTYGSTTAVRKYFESVQPYSISLPAHIDNLYLPGVPRDNLNDVNTYLSSKSLAEYLRLSQSSTRGSISVIGDETIKLRTGVNGYEVVRVVHAFTSRGGFMTHLDITTEQFYYGEAVLNQKETKRVEEISSKSVGTYRSFYYDNEKVKQITGVLIQPGIEDPKSGTSHYSD